MEKLVGKVTYVRIPKLGKGYEMLGLTCTFKTLTIKYPLINSVMSKDEFIVSRIYRMPIDRTFLYIEEYIVSNLPYRVSQYALDMPLFCLFPPKILRKIRKFSGNSPKIQKTRRNF